MTKVVLCLLGAGFVLALATRPLARLCAAYSEYRAERRVSDFLISKGLTPYEAAAAVEAARESRRHDNT